MSVSIPKIDGRGYKEIYDQAVRLARVYCRPDWENILKEKPDEDDLGVVILKLFSTLTETIIRQMNRAPEKHRLAFYDFIGIDHQPPSPAKAPLTFSLAEGTGNVVIVPERTRAASSEDKTVVFETLSSLSAVNFKISSLFSINPWEDKYTDHAGSIADPREGFSVFGGDKYEERMPHHLYITDTDDTLFNVRSPVTVTIDMKGMNAQFKDYFATWLYNGEPVENINSDGFPIITFQLKAFSKSVVNKREGHWLRVGPAPGAAVLKDQALPEISWLEASVTGDKIFPDVCLYNDAPLEFKKGFYPFGRMPKVGDAFYIGCNEVFSKPGAGITITFNAAGGISPDGVTLVWEYWDGERWSALTVTDNTNNFTNTGIYNTTFTCPDIKPLEISGIEDGWIRVRIASGGYGTAGGYEETLSIDDILTKIDFSGTNWSDDETLIKEEIARDLEAENITFGFTYREPSYNPPFIQELHVGYSFTKAIDGITTYNNFHYQDIDAQAGKFFPYTSLEENMPALYMGIKEDIARKHVTLYFSLKSVHESENIPLIGEHGYNLDNKSFEERVKGFRWQYHTGSEWKEMTIKDETDFLSRSGIVGFTVPSDIGQYSLFDETRYWIKIGLLNGKWIDPPTLKGIYPNTVYAESATVIKKELLGSSNGKPYQVLYFSGKPVMSGQVVEVKEPGLPTQEELEIIESEEGKKAVRTVKDKTGEIEEVWVRWHEVNTFAHSGPYSRHYVVDRVNGSIQFGDGAKGMIPPALPNNISALEYKSGGGAKANVKERLITELKTTIPNIEAVTNHDSASGGRDLEYIEDVLERAPYSIKNRGRAITKEDFEKLALESSFEVAKARCVVEADKTIKVIIAPVTANENLHPENSLIDYVETYLKESAFFAVSDRIKVVGPSYTLIHVNVEIVPVLSSEGEIVANRIKTAVKDYLHPLKGGNEGKGWEFGRSIYLSEIATIIEDVKGVDYIGTMTISKDAEPPAPGSEIVTQVSIDENALPSAGEVSVTIISGEQ